MQRLVLAVIVVVVLVTVLAVAVTALRRALAGDGAVATLDDSDTGMRKIAYALLVGLILYVSFAGPG